MRVYSSFLYVCFLIYLPFSLSNLFAKKIVVTGGAGFIGSHVVEKLLERGDYVVIIDNINDAYPVELKYYNLSLVQRKNIDNKLSFYNVDICDSEQMENIFSKEKPDVICHLAARAGVRVSITHPYEYFRSNIMGTLTVFEMARKYSVNHIVCASSSSVYGVRSDSPFYETDAAEKQSSPYGMTKRVGELLAHVYNYLFNISITNLRFFTVYGPRGRIDMVPFIFMDALYHDKPLIVYGDGTAVRDFTYIDDIVTGIIMALDTPLGYEIINLGRGEPIVMNDFIKIMENVVGKKATIKHQKAFAGDVPNTHANISKARSLLGYNPRISIADGLRIMYDWYISGYEKVRDVKE